MYHFHCSSPIKRSLRYGLQGFSLLELLVVVAVLGIMAAGTSLALPDMAERRLLAEADRLAAILQTARAQARAAGVGVEVELPSNARTGFQLRPVWPAEHELALATPEQEPSASSTTPAATTTVAQRKNIAPSAQWTATDMPDVLAHPQGLLLPWLHEGTRAQLPQRMRLGPEPIEPAQSITLLDGDGRSVQVSSDGVQAFAVHPAPSSSAQGA